MLSCDNCHRVRVLHLIGSVEFGDTVVKQSKHQAGPRRDQRTQGREPEFTWELGVSDFALVWLGGPRQKRIGSRLRRMARTCPDGTIPRAISQLFFPQSNILKSRSRYFRYTCSFRVW